MPDAIRIRVTRRVPVPGPRDPREAFWAKSEQTSDDNRSIANSEAKLRRRFGIELRNALLRHLGEPLRELDKEFFPGSLLEFERLAFDYMSGASSESGQYRYQFIEAYSRLLEQRQQVLRESPGLRSVQERMAAAAGVSFSTRIAGYSSLNLDLLVGSIKQVARAFDDDFDSLRVFLEMFVPEAYARVFDVDHADSLDFAITIPTTVEHAFRSAAQGPVPQGAAVPLGAGGTAVAQRDRAEWLWRLANGSLLVPVLLALVVLYQGMKMLEDIRGSQHEMLMPILEHQLKLLQEDRLRMGRDAAQPVTVPGERPTTSGK